MRAHESTFACRWRRCARGGPYADAHALFAHLDAAHVPPAGRCAWAGCARESALTSARQRADHYRTHANYRPYVCARAGCGEGFASEYALLRHALRHVSTTAATRARPADSEPELACRWAGCVRAYAGDVRGAAALAAHLARRHRALPCRWAGCRRRPQGSIASHLRTHLPEWYKPHTCERCGKGFSALCALKRHITYEKRREANNGTRAGASSRKRARASLDDSESEGEDSAEEESTDGATPLPPRYRRVSTSNLPSFSVPLSSSTPRRKRVTRERIREPAEAAEASLREANAALHERVLLLEKVVADMQSKMTNVADQGEESAGFSEVVSENEKEGEDWALCM